MYIQDYLTLKVLKLNWKSVTNLKAWDKLIYSQDSKKFVWIYIWYECEHDWEASFLYKLSQKQLERFYFLDKKAKSVFENIKQELKTVFKDLTFISSKMDFSWNTIYIYFYSDERVDFRPFLWEVKSLIGMNFFLYQVGARDRVRLHPQSGNLCWDCGWWLCCLQSKCKLCSVETTSLDIQNLHWQWIDRQKWICWKLKCCLKYEEDEYMQARKNSPETWTTLEKDWKIYIVVWVNLLMNYMFLKDKEWNVSRHDF